MNNPEEFKQTGNQVPVRMDEMISYIHDRLDQYDKLTEATQAKPSYSPYRDPMIYTTQEGKTIQIPTEIQKKAINQWSQVKKQQEQEHHKQLQEMNTRQEMMGSGPYSENMRYAPFESSGNSDTLGNPGNGDPGHVGNYDGHASDNRHPMQEDPLIEELPVDQLPMSEEDPNSNYFNGYRPRYNQPNYNQNYPKSGYNPNYPKTSYTNQVVPSQEPPIKETDNNSSNVFYLFLIIFALGAMYYVNKNGGLRF